MAYTLRANHNVVFRCTYHVVWCPKYRRAVLVGAIRRSPLRLLKDLARQRRAEIREIEVLPDHVHLLVNVDPQYGIHRLVKHLKGRSSHVLRATYTSLRSRLPTLWTNSYFVATVGGATLVIVKQYIERYQHA